MHLKGRAGAGDSVAARRLGMSSAVRVELVSAGQGRRCSGCMTAGAEGLVVVVQLAPEEQGTRRGFSGSELAEAWAWRLLICCLLRRSKCRRGSSAREAA